MRDFLHLSSSFSFVAVSSIVGSTTYSIWDSDVAKYFGYEIMPPKLKVPPPEPLDETNSLDKIRATILPQHVRIRENSVATSQLEDTESELVSAVPAQARIVSNKCGDSFHADPAADVLASLAHSSRESSTSVVKKVTLKPESVWIRGDLYGPPDPVSNLPHIKFVVRENETAVERKLREMRQEAHEWNHKFWHTHNTKFLKEKEDYIIRFPKKKLSADELSVFYKDFLDRNHRLHRAYNKELYIRNIKLLWPEFLVSVQRLLRRSRF